MTAAALTLESLAFLRSPAGERLLAEAAEIEAGSRSFLHALTRLRRAHAADHVTAALETVVLRRRAARKFSRAAAMFFTPDGLEQATGEGVSRHCAARFERFESVADLCCGIGGDTLGLAAVTRVYAVDRDPLRLAIARANCEAYGVAGRVTFLQREIGVDPLPATEAAFCDPGRRNGARRIFDVADYQPALSAVVALSNDFGAQSETTGAIGIKVSPGIKDESVPENCEIEFVQERRELKQATLWFGPLRTCARRATLLPGGETVADAAAGAVAVTDPAAFLYEPDPAVIRAHTIEQLAAEIGATKLDASTAFLTSPGYRRTPFARAFKVEEWMPFNLKALRRRLQQLDVGPIVVKKRASPLDPQELERMLGLKGTQRRVLVLTAVRGRHSVIICRECDAGREPSSAVD